MKKKNMDTNSNAGKQIMYAKHFIVPQQHDVMHLHICREKERKREREKERKRERERKRVKNYPNANNTTKRYYKRKYMGGNKSKNERTIPDREMS
jgi:hypothetical protein